MTYVDATVVYWYGEHATPRDGGGLRALAWLEALRAAGLTARIHPLNDGPPVSSPPSLVRRLKRTVAPMPLTRKVNLPPTGVVISTVPGTFPDIGRSAAPVVFDWMDRWSTNALTMSSGSLVRMPGASIQSLGWRLRETRLPHQAAWNTFAGYSDWQSMSPNRGAWLPTPVRHAQAMTVGKRIVRRVGFIGNLAYEPNELSLKWFLRRFEKRFISAGLEIVVAGFGTERIREWPTQATIMGPVNNVETFYQGIDAAIVPIKHGGGIKVKAVEALMHGIPVIATNHVFEGFSPETSTRGLYRIEDFIREPGRALEVQNHHMITSEFSIEKFRMGARQAVERAGLR